MTDIDGTMPNNAAGPPRPPWVLPVIVAIVAVTIVALALVFTRGSDDDDASDGSTPTSAAPATSAGTATTEPVTTEPTPTDPAPTEPPSTDPAPTDPPAPEGPLADDVSTLSPGQASIADGTTTRTFELVSTCRTTVAVGLQLVSSMMVADDGTLQTLDVFFDEGAIPTIEISDVSGQIGGFVYGQDGGDPAMVRWSAGSDAPLEPVNQLTLDSIGSPVRGDGSSVGPVNISYVPVEAGECGTGFIVEPWPYAAGEPPTFRDQFDDPPGYGFTVLALCADSTLLLSEGALLSSADFGSGLSTSFQRAIGDGFDYWVSPEPIGPDDQLVEQQGGGGDVTAAIRVETFDDDRTAYLTWLRQPTVEGGLATVECDA